METSNGQNVQLRYRCTQCGSLETETVKRRVGIVEKLTLLLIPAGGILGLALGALFFIIALSMADTLMRWDIGEMVGYAALMMLVLPGVGIFLGILFGKLFIRRRRRKQNLSAFTCRCKLCSHVFIPTVK